MSEHAVDRVCVLNESIAVEYCAARDLIDPHAEATARSLGGGVSNTVIKVESGSTQLVLKQALGKLRVEADWFASRDRIAIEAAALRAIGTWAPNNVPQVLDEDPANYILVMECAPASAVPWKSQLLDGQVSLDTATSAGRLLAEIHGQSAKAPTCRSEFASIDAFDALRIDPYYRTIARIHPDLESRIQGLIDRMLARRCALIHGDYSPKNILVDATRLILIDCEVCHWGDPGFDTAFCLNHLLLKAQYRPEWSPRFFDAAGAFWNAYSIGGIADDAATIEHLGPLMLARIDGKSPVEYIRDEGLKDRVRTLARALILDPPATIVDTCERVRCATEAP